MTYELILRPNSTGPVCVTTLRNKLRFAGLQVHPDSVPHGMLIDNLASFEITPDMEVPAGVRVLVKIPCGYDFIEVNIELLNLERIAGIIDAKIIDGDEVMVHAGPAGIASVSAFHDRYERASSGARENLEVT